MPADSLNRNPYVGPRTFLAQEADRFFGRERQASQMLSLITASRVVLLYSPSGAGKSSFLNAGVIPSLSRDEFMVLPIARVGSPMPSIEAAETENIYVLNTLSSWDHSHRDLRELARLTLAEYLEQLARPVDDLGAPVPLVAIWDQFEELFTSYPEQWEKRQGFFRQLAAALQAVPRLRVVLTLREEYLAQLDPYASLLPDRLRIRLRLERLDDETARAALTLPLARTGMSFGPGVAELLVAELLKIRVLRSTGEIMEVIGQYVEPMQLQVVASTLWERLPADTRVITGEHLQNFGNADQALSNFYEAAIQRVTQQAGVQEKQVRYWFEHQLITPAGTRSIVFRGQHETAGLPNEALDLLVQAYLIRAEFRAGALWYELTHDRFIEPIRSANQRWRSITA